MQKQQRKQASKKRATNNVAHNEVPTFRTKLRIPHRMYHGEHRYGVPRLLTFASSKEPFARRDT
eukprot:2621635-Karenia_brevis.AAC.1